VKVPLILADFTAQKYAKKLAPLSVCKCCWVAIATLLSLSILNRPLMKQQWTDRGIKGAKYLLVGAFLILGREPALHMAQGSNLGLASVSLIFGVIGPILMVIGLYLIGTRHK
jgi:hypothetical protein